MKKLFSKYDIPSSMQFKKALVKERSELQELRHEKHIIRQLVHEIEFPEPYFPMTGFTADSYKRMSLLLHNINRVWSPSEVDLAWEMVYRSLFINDVRKENMPLRVIRGNECYFKELLNQLSCSNKLISGLSTDKDWMLEEVKLRNRSYQQLLHFIDNLPWCKEDNIIPVAFKSISSL